MFIIAGPPGAGKTTQSKRLAKDTDFTWVSAGELLRKYATGEQRKVMLNGGLVDDSYVEALIVDELRQHEDNLAQVLLDGFPRDFAEARWLVETYGANISGYIIFDVTEDVVLDRLAKRGRPDDTPESIKQRLDVFHRETESIIDYFVEQLIPVIKLDGNKTQAEVYEEFAQAVGVGHE